MEGFSRRDFSARNDSLKEINQCTPDGGAPQGVISGGFQLTQPDAYAPKMRSDRIVTENAARLHAQKR